MSLQELSPSAQNTLKAVWSLQEWSEEPVTTSGVAAKLGVKPSTASDAIRKLGEQGLLDHARYGSVSLTPEGRAQAVAVVRGHRLLETFLVQVLGYRWDEVHDEADRLEHAVSGRFVDRIDAFLGRPTRDPHGDPIPAADGTVRRPTAVLLAQVPEESEVVVERISDADAALLQFLADRGIGVGTRLAVAEGAPFSDAIDVRIDGRSDAVALGSAATEAIWVSAP